MKTVLKKSASIKAKHSETYYQLVENDGVCSIEKVFTLTTSEEVIEAGLDAKKAFRELMATKTERAQRRADTIGEADAFHRHYLLGKTFRQIADEVGKKGTGPIANRARKGRSALALRYLEGASLQELAIEFEAPEKLMHAVLAEELENQREKTIRDFQRGWVLSDDLDSCVKQMNAITQFLGDETTVRYQLVCPFTDTQKAAIGKLPIFTEAFYTVTFWSTRTKRIDLKAYNAIMSGDWNKEQALHLLKPLYGDRVVDVADWRAWSDKPCRDLLHKYTEPLGLGKTIKKWASGRL